MVWTVGAFVGGVYVGVALMAFVVASRKCPPEFAPWEKAKEDFSPATCRGVWHLTPRGWVIAAKAEEMSQPIEGPPADRVMTCCFREHTPWLSCSAVKKESDLWRCDDPDAIHALIEKFGESPPVVMELAQS